jgi:hypothetical protein
MNQIKKEAINTSGIIFGQLYDLIRENDYHSLLNKFELS